MNLNEVTNIRLEKFTKIKTFTIIAYLCSNYTKPSKTNEIEFENYNTIVFDANEMYITNYGNIVSTISYEDILFCAITYLPEFKTTLLIFKKDYFNQVSNSIIKLPIQDLSKPFVCNYICQYPYDKCEYRQIGGICAADLTCGYGTVNGVNTFKHGSMILPPDENNTIS